jgi:hypothetical protein
MDKEREKFEVEIIVSTNYSKALFGSFERKERKG